MRIVASLGLLIVLSAVPAAADTLPRWIPERCLEIAEDDVRSRPLDGGSADSRWNESYAAGFAAIQRDEIHLAEQEMCRALIAARGFGPRDWRFAETLDELGLIAYMLRDFELAERVQGAAIAELLLAVGPGGEPLHDAEISAQSPLRSDCRSGITTYTTRLGWIHEEVPGRVATSELERAPWRVFAAGYLPLDESLADRLEWLLSQYLLEENLAAAEELAELRSTILGDFRPSRVGKPS